MGLNMSRFLLIPGFSNLVLDYTSWMVKKLNTKHMSQLYFLLPSYMLSIDIRRITTLLNNY